MIKYLRKLFGFCSVGISHDWVYSRYRNHRECKKCHNRQTWHEPDMLLDPHGWYDD